MKKEENLDFLDYTNKRKIIARNIQSEGQPNTISFSYITIYFLGLVMGFYLGYVIGMECLI